MTTETQKPWLMPWFSQLINDYKKDKESVYHTWFIDPERIKYFGAIRRGVHQVVADIKSGSFPNELKGSSLEIVVEAISEQKQVFAGANHPWVWKPKLRIPDIYENQTNKREFGKCLEVCLSSSSERKLLAAVAELATQKIKGLGPALSNILYFLHPTLFPAFNTAIVRGFNAATSFNVQLGSWDHYFFLREQILEINQHWKTQLSTDLGAISGLFFEIGIGRLRLPAIVLQERRPVEFNQSAILRAAKKRREERQAQQKEEQSHTMVQYELIKLGNALGYKTWVARNDRSNEWRGEKFSFLTIDGLPQIMSRDVDQQTVELIDVLWFDHDKIVCAFEVEHSTAIYSGALRLFDLAKILKGKVKLFIVAPDSREEKLIQILTRPTFCEEVARYQPKYLLYNEFCECCSQIAKFSQDWRGLETIAKSL